MAVVSDTPVPDEALMLKVVDGNDGALETLIERHSGELRVYIGYRVCDPCGTEDVLQETWIRVFNNADRFEPGRSFLPWLRSIAHHISLDHLKNRKRRHQHEYAAYRDVEEARVEVNQVEQDDFVTKALAALPGDVREVVNYVVIQGGSLRGAARDMNTQFRDVAKRLAEGKRIICELC